MLGFLRCSVGCSPQQHSLLQQSFDADASDVMQQDATLLDSCPWQQLVSALQQHSHDSQQVAQFPNKCVGTHSIAHSNTKSITRNLLKEII